MRDNVQYFFQKAFTIFVDQYAQPTEKRNLNKIYTGYVCLQFAHEWLDSYKEEETRHHWFTEIMELDEAYQNILPDEFFTLLHTPSNAAILKLYGYTVVE